MTGLYETEHFYPTLSYLTYKQKELLTLRKTSWERNKGTDVLDLGRT